MARIFSRQELYERVWLDPISTLAKEFGLSDRGLGKLCTRHDIPVPPRGYWARVRSGLKLTQAPLPKHDVKEKKIVIKPFLGEQAPQIAEMLDVPPEVITISKNLRTAHPVIARWLQQEAERNYHYPRMRGCYGTAIARRRLRLIDTVLKALTKHDFTINSTQEDVEKLCVSLDKAEIEFSVTILHKEEGEQLSLRIYSDDVPHMRKHWCDDSRGSLEDKLGFAVQAFKIIAPLSQAAAIEREEARIQYEKEQEERKEQEKFLREEVSKLQTLRLESRNWEKANLLRAYVAAVSQSIAEGKTSAGDIDFEDWKLWALSHADQIDPLTSGRTFIKKKEHCYSQEEPEWDSPQHQSHHYPNLWEASTQWTFRSPYYR